MPSNSRSSYDALAGLYAPVGGAVLVLVLLLTAIAVARGRRRARRPGAPSSARDEHNPLEAAYAVLLIAVAATLAVFSLRSWDKVSASTHAKGLVVGVDAAKWRWRFVYPGTGVSSIGRVVVPAGRPIRFEGRSQDVLHDFWVPDVRFQRQVFPDRTTVWTLTFPAGTHDGVCAWFCGLRHDAMRFTVEAVSAGAYRRWLAAHRSGA